MQYKKKFINDKILEAGKAEYLEKGFRAGNISVIAENAGVPVGNLYRYFDGKSGLLDAIVAPAYAEIPAVLDKLAALDGSFTDLDTLMSTLSKQLIKIFKDYGEELLILADKCAHTRYEDFSAQITGKVASIVLEKLYKNPDSNDIIMAQLAAKAFFNSLFDILRMKLEGNIMEEMLLRLLRFYFIEADKRK